MLLNLYYLSSYQAKTNMICLSQCVLKDVIDEMNKNLQARSNSSKIIK